MKAFVIIFFSLLTAESYSVDYRLESSSFFSGRQLSERFNCPARGTFCANCKTIVSCERSGAQPLVVMNCLNLLCNDEGLVPTCNSTGRRQCTDLGTLEFKCATHGIFADPVYCNRYHYCVNSTACGSAVSANITASSTDVVNPSLPFTAIQQECPSNYSYNIATRYCDKLLQGNVCPKNTYPLRLCRYPGEMFPIQGPQYAVCIQFSPTSSLLYPYQYTCQSGKTFSGSHPC